MREKKKKCKHTYLLQRVEYTTVTVFWNEINCGISIPSMSTSQANIRSVIHEYEILYTTRIQQKSKNWNDGKLAFYEFNKKIEIHNDDGMLLATDFYRSRLISSVLNSVLVDNSEFRLPNANYLIQIQDKIRVFEREVNLRAKTSDSQKVEKLATKNESVPKRDTIISKSPSLGHPSMSHRKVTSRNLVATDTKNQNSSINGNLTKLIYSSMGATRMKKTHSPKNNRIHNIAKPSSSGSNINKGLTASKPLRYQGSNVTKTTQNVSGTTTGAKISQYKVHSNDLLTIDSKVSKRLPLRIPPRTSTCFQYIYTPRNDIEKFDVAANDISIYKPLIISGNEPSGEEPIQEKENGQEYVGSKGYDENQKKNENMHNSHDKEMKVNSRPSQPKIVDEYTNTDSVTFSNNEISRISVKKEQPLIVSNTTVDDTDIVYNLSDYEENEKFNAMIKKIKQTQNLEDNSSTSVVNKKPNIVKTGLEAVEFCLSTDSEMEEI